MPQGDTQADLTERARDYLDDHSRSRYRPNTGRGAEYDCLVGLMVAFAQSEREAATAEARRAVPPEAIAWCATLYRITEYLAKTPAWVDEDIAHLRSIIALLDALASPAPQEETR